MKTTNAKEGQIHSIGLYFPSIHNENMVEHMGASSPGFKFFEKCDLNNSEFFEIIHVCIFFMPPWYLPVQIFKKKYDCMWPTQKRENWTLLYCE